MSKKVWITGAGKGIGRAIAWAMAARGDNVAVSARTEDDLIALKKEAEEAGLPGSIFPATLDVTDRDGNRSVFERIETEMGPLDLAIFNAGTHTPTPPQKFNAEAHDRIMAINYGGTCNGLSAAVPAFVKRGKGHVAVVSSVAGYRGLPNASAYSASKAACIALCESIKPQLDKCGVTVTVINPGFVRTPLTDKNDFPMPFLVEPERAAEIILAGLDKKRFEIAFPWQLVSILKFARILPYRLFFPMVSKQTGL